MLLLLAEQRAHGYELLERLKGFGFSRDPGGLYRVLRSLEREGLVASRWEASEVGPDRCQYQLTPLGVEWLGAWAATLDETRRTLDGYQRRFAALPRGERAENQPTGLPSHPDSSRITPDEVPLFKTLVAADRPAARTTGRR